MKKILSVCLFCLFLLSLTLSYGYSQPAEKFLEEMIKAWGGRKALENIKDITLSGTLELVQFGMNGSVIVYQKEPNKQRLDIEIMGMVITQAFDGETAWGTNPQTGSTEEMSEQAAAYFKRESLGNDAFLNPKKYGIIFALKSTEQIEGKEYTVLEQTFSDGFTITHYVDSKTHLVFKSKSKALNPMGAEVDAETFLSNYKQIDGLTVAHSVTTYQDGAQYMTVTISDVKFNSGLKDSFFKMAE